MDFLLFLRFKILNEFFQKYLYYIIFFYTKNSKILKMITIIKFLIKMFYRFLLTNFLKPTSFCLQTALYKVT